MDAFGGYKYEDFAEDDDWAFPSDEEEEERCMLPRFPRARVARRWIA